LPEDLAAASYDASKRAAKPDVVIKPLTTEEVSAILKLAHEHSVPVYARGAASGVTGGAVPTKGGIVLDFSRMNRVIQINKQNLTAVVEPGVIVSDFQVSVEKKGLFYPPDPASAEFCTIGGNIAECAGGLRCVKYGVTRDYVIGLEVVLANGSIIHTGSHTLKCVTGYDLTRLFVGSEGTLGIFTKITLRLIPKPEHRETLIAFYPNADTAINAGESILSANILPTALEFVDETSTRAVQNYYKDFTLPAGTKAFLIVELDGPKTDTIRLSEQVQILLERKSIKVIRAKDSKEAKTLWAVRKAISPSLYSITAQKINEDISLPLDQVKPMLEINKKLEGKYGIPIATFGHLGDGNLHINLLVSVGGQENVVPEAVKELFTEAIKLGGTLSGEHGIGLTKSPYLALEIPEREMEIMKQLKTIFDPKGILNPGKIFATADTHR